MSSNSSRSHRTRRAFVTAGIFLASSAAIGSLVNSRVSAQTATNEGQLRDTLKNFTTVYGLVEANYAEPITGDKIDKVIYDGAIPGALQTLDPHSNFYDPKAYAQMREDEHGKYYGVGMTIQQQNGKVVCVAPMEGSPSYKAGIRPGDVILKINDQSADNMDSVKVASLLKGPLGTHVQITMGREGIAKPLTFDLTRAEIPRYSVDLAYMIRPGIGYIHITQFIETTGPEVQAALAKFGPDLKGLLLDLRGNPGGLLTEAVAVSGDFLPTGDVVVTQRGRAFPDVTQRVTHGSDSKYPVVVLVNRNTASAAEIVSGALQDHDRALIVGETTFGKGLVQTVFPISDDTGLALTTFHYYTPSGRLIQRNYDNVSLYDYYNERANALPANNTNKEVEHTDAGRIVYGGGGITPDEQIPAQKDNHFQDELLVHRAFFDFTRQYLNTHTVTHDLVVDDALLAQFKAFLAEKKITYTEADFTANLAWLKASIKSDLFTTQFGSGSGLRVIADYDPQIQKALTYMPEAQALESHTLPGEQHAENTAGK